MVVRRLVYILLRPRPRPYPRPRPRPIQQEDGWNSK